MHRLAGSRLVRFTSACLALGLVLGTLPPVMAEKVLNSPQETIDIQLNQTLDTERSHYGDPFEGELVDHHRLGEQVLPQGTLLKGRVEGGHPSMILGMPGYVSLDIQQAVLPSGEIYQFEKDGKGLKTHKYHNPKAQTGKRVMIAGLPFSIISAADAIPLKYAAGMSFWQIAPISMAARMAMGTAWEMSGKHKNSPAKGYPVQTRIGYGMLRGTGLTGAYQLMTTAPEPNLKEGAIISVRLPEKDLKRLFAAGSTVKTVQSLPNQQPAPSPVQPTDLSQLQAADIESQSFESVNAKITPAAVLPNSQPVSTEKLTP